MTRPRRKREAPLSVVAHATAAFLDTNVLIYAQQGGPKGDAARGLLAAGTGVLSVQVLNEFASVARRKLGRSWPEIDAAVADVVAALASPPLPLTVEVHEAGRRLAAEQRLSFYDALIVAAALEARCTTLWSEDFQEGRLFGGALRVANPFAAEARAPTRAPPRR